MSICGTGVFVKGKKKHQENCTIRNINDSIQYNTIQFNTIQAVYHARCCCIITNFNNLWWQSSKCLCPPDLDAMIVNPFCAPFLHFCHVVCDIQTEGYQYTFLTDRTGLKINDQFILHQNYLMCFLHVHVYV